MPSENKNDKATDPATKGETHGMPSNAETASDREGPLTIGSAVNTPSTTSNDVSTLMGKGQGRFKITPSQDSLGRPKGF